MNLDLVLGLSSKVNLLEIMYEHYTCTLLCSSHHIVPIKEDLSVSRVGGKVERQLHVHTVY